MLTLGHTEGVGNVDRVVNAETASEDDVDADDHVDGHVPEVKGANLQGRHVKDLEVDNKQIGKRLILIGKEESQKMNRN